MVSSQNIMVQKTLERHRLSLGALASRLGVAVDELRPRNLNAALRRQVEALSNAQPDPLVAVADVLKAGGQQLRDDLVNDARRLANKVLALRQQYAYMNQRHDAFLTALNHLRLFVYGNAKDEGHDYIVPQKVWQAVRPVEEQLERWVKDNNYAAQSTLYSELLGAYAQLDYLRNTRLPHYEKALDELPAVHAILEDFDHKFAVQEKEVEAYHARLNHLAQEAPLIFDTQGQDLSLTAQMPREARAQAMAKGVLASLKAAQRAEQQRQHQQGKAREQEVVENLFHKLLASPEADQEPDVPAITAAEDLDLNKATAFTPKASPAASLKKVIDVPVPKAPKVVVKLNEEEADAPEATTGNTNENSTAETPAAQLPITPAAKKPPIAEAPTEAVVLATERPSAAKAKALPSKAPARAPQKATHKAPQSEKEAALYKDTGHREPGWQAVDEKMLKHYLKENKGYFSSKAAFAAIQRNIIAINRAIAMGFNASALRQLIKALDWAGEDEPPLPT